MVTFPNDFSGMSGGGIYQIKLKHTDGKFSLEELQLAGVFVAANEKEGWLVSRGHVSLHEIFCSFLDKELELT